MNWLKRIISKETKIKTQSGQLGVPKGLWSHCPQCNQMLYQEELERLFYVCPKCEHHLPFSARKRLVAFFDQGRFQTMGDELQTQDPLKFKDLKKYKSRLHASKESSGENEALIAAFGQLNGMDVSVCVFNFKFMGGSMGSVVGDRFLLAAEKSLESYSPMVVFSASGGARMQESLFSLMQMARTSAAISRLKEKGIPFISVLTNPTYGGVSASLAMLGDLNIAEPKALIGFAGPRVIEQTVREILPKGFQTSEFLLEHGMLDRVVPRKHLREELTSILRLLTKASRLEIKGVIHEQT